MALSNERILYLLNAYSSRQAIESEEQELFAWANETGNHELLQQHIYKLIQQYNSKELVPSVDWEHLYAQILDKSIMHQPPVVHKMRWLRRAVAAVFILSFGVGAYLYVNKPLSKQVIAQPIPAPVVNDVAAPATSKAVLTLADGRKIELDSINSGTLAQQGSVEVLKDANGQITYNGTGSENLYNTVNVPRGSREVNIRLSDGTQVWLNSESSLRYPASFTGAAREVVMTGEVYFEVAHNATMPFVVTKDEMEINVFGTHFNINTYEDEEIHKVTLLEGSVRVSVKGEQNFLKPGQQAQINDKIKLINGVDLEEVMAWKNGKFQFGEKADLHLIMRRIARWYDVEIRYEGGIKNQQFGGEIPMNSNLSQVLEILKTSGVKFKIEGKNVTVTP